MTSIVDPEIAEGVQPEPPEDAEDIVDPEIAEGPRPEPEVAEDAMTGGKRASTMSLKGIQAALDEALKGQEIDPETAALVSSCIAEIDSDKDGHIDRWELVQFSINLIKQVQNLEKKNYSLIFWGKIILAAALLLVLSTFASSTAAVFVAKDMRIENDALVTRGNQAVKTITNEVEATVGALSFLPAEARRHVKSIAFKGEPNEGVVIYDKQVASIVVHPKKSAIVTTTEGDTLTWSIDDNKDSIKITLADGDSWLMKSGCEKCTILNILETEEVSDALDEYHEAVEMVLHEHGRVLHDIGCAHVHTTTSTKCDLPSVYRPYFLSAKSELGKRIQVEVTQALAAQGLDILSSAVPELTPNSLFNMKEDLFDQMFEGVDAYVEKQINIASAEVIDVGSMLKENLQAKLQSVGGAFELDIGCNAVESKDADGKYVKREWKMDLVVTGTLPSVSKTLLATGVKPEVAFLPDPFPKLKIQSFPSLTVNFELKLPVTVELVSQQITLQTATAKVFTKIHAAVSKEFPLSDLSSILPSETVNFQGGFVMETLFTFMMNRRQFTMLPDGTIEDSKARLPGVQSPTVTASGGYLATLDLPVFGKSIPMRATDPNMFDGVVVPCFTYDLVECAGYSCTPGWYNYCLSDMCDWQGTLSSVFQSVNMLAASAGVCPTTLVVPATRQ